MTHLVAKLSIEVGKRFVHQQDLGASDERTAERHPLALSSAQLLGFLVEVLGQLQHGRRFLHATGHVGIGNLVSALGHSKSKRQVVAHRHVRVKGVRLEHHAQPPSPSRQVVDGHAVDGYGPLSDLFQPRKHAKRG